MTSRLTAPHFSRAVLLFIVVAPHHTVRSRRHAFRSCLAPSRLPLPRGWRECTCALRPFAFFCQPRSHVFARQIQLPENMPRIEYVPNHFVFLQPHQRLTLSSQCRRPSALRSSASALRPPAAAAAAAHLWRRVPGDVQVLFLSLNFL